MPSIVRVDNTLFIREGTHFIPTPLTRGPWSVESQHGGPPSALLVRAVENEASPHMALVRATVEILKPIPLAPLRIETKMLRPGKRVQLIRASLIADGTEYAHLTSVHIRQDPNIATPDPLHKAEDPPPPEEATESSELGIGFDQFGLDYERFDSHALEVRYLGRPGTEPGPSKAWVRLRVPLVDGEAPTPAQRVIAAADCGNGISWEIPIDRFLFVNPDLTVYLHRQQVGEWTLLDAVTDLGIGTGLAQSAIFDRQGPIGRSLQSLYVDHR